MKKLLLIFFLLITVSVLAQKAVKTEKTSDHSTYVKGRDFEGCIFGNNYPSIYPNEQNVKLYTPTTDEVILAEKILRQTVDTLHYYGHEYFVRRNLKRYIRQYFGYITQSGEKVVFINALWKSSYKEKRWLIDHIYVSDGGDYYWQTKISLSNKKSLGFYINGEG